MTAKVKCIKIKKRRKESKRETKNRWRAYLKFEDNSIFTLNQVTFENSLSRNYFLKIFKKYYRTSYRPFFIYKILNTGSNEKYYILLFFKSYAKEQT